MEGSRSHLYYIDVLRLMSAAGVVFMHTAASGLRAGVLAEAPFVTRGWHLMNLVTGFAFSAVPLFFMISGYLLLSDERTRDVSLLFRRRLPRLVVPLAFWTLLTVLWQSFSGGEGLSGVLVRLRDALYGPAIIPLWFMYTIITLYLLSPFLYAGLHGLTPGGHRLVLVIIALVSLRAAVAAILPDSLGGYLQFTVLNYLQALGGNLLLMLLGWYLGNWERRLPKPLLLGVVVVTWLVIVLGTYLRTRTHGYYDGAFQNQSAGFEVLLAAGVFLLAKQGEARLSRFRWLRSLAGLTLPVYLMHGLVLLVTFRCVIDPLRFPAILGVTVLVLVVCWLATKTLASVPYLCYASAGLRFDAASESCNWVFTARRLRARRTAGE